MLTPIDQQLAISFQNNKALQEACSLLEEQLTDLEKLADIHEIKSKDLEVSKVPFNIPIASYIGSR